MSVIKWSFYKKLPADIDKGQCNDSKVCQFEIFMEKSMVSVLVKDFVVKKRKFMIIILFG